MLENELKAYPVLDIASANIVLLGNFNPYIISPEWLEDRKIWKAGNVHMSLGALRQDGVQFRSEGTEWNVSSDRLIISSVSADCGALAEAVLVELPHTPMVAVVSSFSFHGLDSAAEGVFDAIRATIPNQQSAELLRWGAVMHVDGVRVDMTFVTGNEGTTVAVNHRRTTRTSTEARIAAAKYQADKSISQDLIQGIIQGAEK